MIIALLSIAHAEIEPATNVTLAISNWRLGFSADLRYGIRIPMFEKDGSPLFQNTGLTTQGTAYLSPAYARGGIKATFSPLAILDVNAYYTYDRYFGNFQTIVDYDNADSNYGTNEDIAQYVSDTNRQGSGDGWHGGGSITLKAKAGPMIILSNTDYSYWNIQQDEAAGDWFFEREKEVMMQLEGDTLLEENALLLYEHPLGEDPGRNLRAGSFTTWRASMNADDRLLRTGLLAMYNQPSGWSHTLILQPYITDRAMESFPPYFAYALRYNN